MLKILIEVVVTDERENEIVKEAGMGYKNLVKYVDRKIVDMFEADKLHAYVKDVKIIPIYEKDEKE